MNTEPLWVSVLRRACEGGRQATVADLIGYSPAVVSSVLKGNYKGDVERVQRTVEGALMGSRVECPVVGEIGFQKCIEHQRAQFRATNHAAVQLYRACRSGCPNSLIKAAEGGKEIAS